MEHIHIISFPVYGYKVNLVVTTDINQSRSSRNLEIGNIWEHHPGVQGLHSYDDDRAECYIFLYKHSKGGLIAHECYHAISRMFRWVGGKKIDEEVFAYHLGYLVEEIEKKLNLEK